MKLSVLKQSITLVPKSRLKTTNHRSKHKLKLAVEPEERRQVDYQMNGEWLW